METAHFISFATYRISSKTWPHFLQFVSYLLYSTQMAELLKAYDLHFLYIFIVFNRH
jgi:hypothetical protein